MFHEYRQRLLGQLSLDFNTDPGSFLEKENIITTSARNAGRRNYSPDKAFLQMATLGGNTVIMADECLHAFLQELVRNVEGHRLFELGMLTRLNEELKQYGYQMAPTHHMFLPCRDVRAEERCRVEWLYDDAIYPFYGDPRFPNAIAFPEPCPARPDRIAVVAVDGGYDHGHGRLFGGCAALAADRDRCPAGLPRKGNRLLSCDAAEEQNHRDG